ncbi:MAG: hypothetical protein KDB00_19850 [Planctomycetales bacterium]|nr:hypothetical protein [Planctomycetales bacterium]
MEARLPLAADTGHNFLMPVDVNDDGQVQASDALAIINALARQSYEDEGTVIDAQSADAGISSMFYDVNDDGQTSPNDAIRVINHLARSANAGDSKDAAEVISGTDQVRARIELEYKSSGRAEFQVRIRGAQPDVTLDVTVGDTVVGQIQTDANGRGKLELEFDGSSVPVPEVIANATSTTPISIGDVITGTLGSLGEIGSDDGGDDESSDGHSDGHSDGGGDDDDTDEVEHNDLNNNSAGESDDDRR